MGKQRADVVLVARGLTPTRALARAAIEAGGVFADGVAVAKPSAAIDEDAKIAFTPPHPWVSRAGVKLAHALAAFSIDPADRVCLDIGASTGGFTHVLTNAGAQRVYAVDVGRGQLHPSLHAHPRVAAMEGQDARTLTRDLLTPAPSLIVCDASFIGLEKVLTPALALAAPVADVIALIKPQFETGPRAKALIPHQEAQSIAETVADSLNGVAGFHRAGLIESPLLGGSGAVEFLLLLQRKALEA
jgi:23S rRNA (cytidine1920-2'-O)/16S rRNA (cytidine1409-2'-O)-methyltransferase